MTDQLPVFEKDARKNDKEKQWETTEMEKYSRSYFFF